MKATFGKLAHGIIGMVAVAMVFAMLPAAPASAQVSATSDIAIQVPSIVILYYYPTINVGLSQAALLTALTGGTNPISMGAISPAAGGFSQDLNIVPTDLNIDPTATVLELDNAWAVRSIHANNVQVSIALTSDTLSFGGGSSTIVMSNEQVGVGGTWGSSVAFPAPGIQNYTTGDVRLSLDFTNATESGNYTGGQFEITAEAL
jgi:hypothetical protein